MKNNYNLKKLASVFIFSSVFYLNTFGQSSPAAQSLQYNQSFLIAANVTTYPTGWQGWSLGSAASATFRTTAPTINSNLIANGNASIASGGVYNYNGKIGILASESLDPCLAVAIKTTSLTNIQVKFDAMTIRNPFDGSTNTMINGFDLQYSVGTIAGTWTSTTGMANGFYQNSSTNQTGAVTTPQNILGQTINLPAACNNQSVVYLRWVSRDISGVGSRASFAIDNVIICPIGTPTISISGPNATCSGQALLFLASITSGGTTPVYQWKKNGTNTGGNTSTISLTGLVVGDQISCGLTSNAGCLTTNVATSNTISIVSAGAPVISTAAITGTCIGARTGAIDITVNNGTSPYNFAWDTINTKFGAMYFVTVDTKTGANPLPGGVGLSFYIDGIETKELFVTKGISYSFNVMNFHPFHISTDSIGANSSFIVTNGQTGAPTGNGTVTFKPNNLHTTMLYYPCASHQTMGWRINVQNGFNVEDLSNIKSGIYNVIVTDAHGCTSSGSYTVDEGSGPEICDNGLDDNCDGNVDEGCGVTLQLKLYLEGYYSNNQLMRPVLFTTSHSNSPLACDSITVELRDPVSPYNIVATKKALLKTNGSSQVLFPFSIQNNSYYIVIRHRNAIETWSKNPLLFDSLSKSYDFTK